MSNSLIKDLYLIFSRNKFKFSSNYEQTNRKTKISESNTQNK